MLPSKRPLEGESESVLKKSCLCFSADSKNVGEGSGSGSQETNIDGTSSVSLGNSNINNSGSREERSITEMAFDVGKSQDIDEDLHSRQLAVYGRETMRRLFASNVLVSGMQGLGVEIAKNLILAGVKSVMLHDEGKVELWDLSSNFIFSENDVGKNRALASIQKLQELNNAVVISTLTTELMKEQLSEFQAVIFTDISLENAIEFNEYCHNHQPPIAFIKTEVRGLFGNCFCDFGPEFTVFDVDGEEPHTGIIASISNDNPALVSCVDDERLEFQDGDLVVFSEVQGMTELNDGKPRKIKTARPYSFILDEDTTSFSRHEKGGVVTQVKQPKVLNFKPLREAIKDPGDFLLCDFSKFDRPPLLHLAFQSLDKFVSELGRFPVAGSEDDAQRLISITSNLNDSLGDAKLDDINPKLLKHFAFGARAVLNPMAAMFGGFVGQEVVKACSGKFHPLFQFFYFDSVESLPVEPLDPSDFRPLNSRYDAQISVLGSKLQRRLEDAKVFLVGSGALGCEFLKNLALMGVSCGNQGKLMVTDDDDDDTNYHMDLISGLANMRARNYGIPEVDKLKAKFIAGRIIPAIATSTAMATGLVCLELYKVINGGHKLEDYRNTFANLALPLFSMAEPVPPKVIKYKDLSWTLWDRWIIKGNPTLRELLKWLEDKGLNAYSISFGSCLLYNSMFPRHKERMDKKMVDLAREVAKAELPPYRRHLDIVVACEDDEDNDIEIPQISVYFD
ncbi:unnamed protein product [Fraxinus pennsylvanica]|uniref:Ubiquitin-like 1-activating enzyme E1A n=1 Tax=Fraxinus pennsylvanica TaxID=56036 RepID=A0AAD1ZZI0_9LAMI|nr:unnamed protein product [Fraxinus pennsylvanica]